MTQTVIDDRFKKLGPYAQDELIRDLKTLVNEINLRLVDGTTNEELAALGASLAGTYASLAYLAANYTTTANLTTILSGYVTAASLSLTLAGYSTTTAMNTAISSAITTALTGVLANIKALSWVAGDVIGFNGANTPVRIPKGTSLQLFRMNAGATLQEYVDPWNILYQGEIGNAVDLDTLTTTGFWQQTDDAEAATGSHYPIAKAGLLVISGGHGASGIVFQKYTTIAAGYEWTRKKVAGTWSAWVITLNANVPKFSSMDGPAYSAPGGATLIATYTILAQQGGANYAISGLFTAPIAGLYHFTHNELSNANTLHMQMWKNSNSALLYGLSYNNAAVYDYHCISSIVPMAAGDTIGVWVIAGYYAYGSSYRQFTGELVG